MPEAGDAERLVILLEAKVNDLEKNMAKASGVTAKAYRQMSLGSRSATKQMEADAIRSSLRINQALASTSAKVGEFSRSFMAGAVAPIAGLLTLGAAIKGTRDALDKFGDINDKVIASGLNSDLFQTLAYEAKLAGVEIEGAGSALATFNKNLGDAQAGRGRMLTALDAVSPALAKQVATAKNTEMAFRAVSSALRDARSDAERAAIAAAAFGDSGTKLANAWAIGADKIDETVAKAQQLGIVVDRDLIEKADEYGDKWDTAAEIIDINVKKALANLSPWMVNLVGNAAEFTRLLNVAAEQLQDIDQRQFLRPLQNQLIEIENRMAPLKTSIADLEGQLAATDPTSGWAGVLAADIRDKTLAYEALADQAQALQERIAQLQGKPVGSVFLDADTVGAGPGSFADLAGMMGPNSGAVARPTFDFRKYLDQWYANSLEGYPDIFRTTTKEVKKTTAAIIDNSNAVTELSQNWQTAQELTVDFASTFINGMRSGKSAIEAAADALGNLGDQLINMAANQAIQSFFGALSGGLVGGFGSIAGGAAIPMGGFIPGLTGPRLFADGTANTGGRVGEPRGIVHGQEAVIPLPNGGKVPVQLSTPSTSPIGFPDQTRARSTEVHMNVSIDARNAQQGVAEQLDQWARLRLPGLVRKAINDPHAVG